MNTRKVLVISIVVLLIAALGLGVWNLFLKSPESPSESDESSDQLPTSTTTTREPARPSSTKATQTDSILPEPKEDNDTEESASDLSSGGEKSAEEKKLKQLTEEEILGPKITGDGNFVKYYQKKDGRVFKVSFSGKTKKKISDTKIPNLKSVNWSPKGEQVITTWVEENIRRKTHYSYKTGEATQIDTRMKKIKWAPNGEQIFYHFIDKTGQSNLAIAEPDNSNWQSIEPMSIESTKIYWPHSNFLSVVTPGGELYPTIAYRVPLSSNKEEEILERLNFDSGLRWSNEGGLFLFKRNAGGPLSLYRFNKGPDNLKLTASIDKCSWAENDKSVYCAVSAQEIIDEGLLPESYSEEFLPQSDSFWQIDLEDRKVRELYIPKSTQNVINVKKETLRVGPDKNYLFWVDGGTNRLYRLKL